MLIVIKVALCTSAALDIIIDIIDVIGYWLLEV